VRQTTPPGGSVPAAQQEEASSVKGGCNHQNPAEIDEEQSQLVDMLLAVSVLCG